MARILKLNYIFSTVLKRAYILLIIGTPQILYSQTEPNKNSSISAEFFLGISAASNENFPERELQKQFILNHTFSERSSGVSSTFENLRKGLSVGITDFGNTRELGYAFTIMPYLQFPILKSKKL